MLSVQKQSENQNAYEAFFNKEITLEEFALLIGIEPHLVILQMKELIVEYEEQYKFVPSLALYEMASDLYNEYNNVPYEIEETHDRIHVKLNIADNIRKTAKTLDELKRVRQSSTVVIQNNMMAQVNNIALEQVINRISPYLCPKCQEKLLDKFDELTT